MRVTTRHCESVDIYTASIDPGRSSYAQSVDKYAEKVSELLTTLGVKSVLWGTPEDHPPKFLEPRKPIEYLLEVAENRVVAYVNESTWSSFLYDERDDYEFSRTPATYELTSILIATPIESHEVKARRIYRSAGRPDQYELVEEVTH